MRLNRLEILLQSPRRIGSCWDHRAADKHTYFILKTYLSKKRGKMTDQLQNDNPSAPPQAESDVLVLIKKIQQHIAVLIS